MSQACLAMAPPATFGLESNAFTETSSFSNMQKIQKIQKIKKMQKPKKLQKMQKQMTNMHYLLNWTKEHHVNAMETLRVKAVYDPSSMDIDEESGEKDIGHLSQSSLVVFEKPKTVSAFYPGITSMVQ